MRKIFIITLIVGFFLISCEETTSILETNGDDNIENSYQKVGIVSNYTEVKAKLARTYTIIGDKGGKIIEKHTWTNLSDTLKLEAYLTIPKNAFTDTLTFELIFDPNLLSVQLHPTPFSFNIPVILDLKYKGISVDFEIDSTNLDFQYYKPDGTFEDVNYKNIIWEPEKRTLMVFKAELHHFSRYGWTRTNR